VHSGDLGGVLTDAVDCVSENAIRKSSNARFLSPIPESHAVDGV